MPIPKVVNEKISFSFIFGLLLMKLNGEPNFSLEKLSTIFKTSMNILAFMIFSVSLQFMTWMIEPDLTVNE